MHVDLLNHNNSQYFGDIAIGTPAQRFTAIFDTGSGTSWVPGSACNDDTCREHHQFDDKASSSFQPHEGSPNGSISYGTGKVHIKTGRDTLQFCDSRDNAGCHGATEHHLQVGQQPFGVAERQTSYPFRVLPFDGILGLAPSGNSTSVLKQLKDRGALERNVVGVYLSDDPHRNGSIAFGGVEPAHISDKAPVHWHPIQSDSEWTVSMKDILVDGKPLHLCDDQENGVCSAVVDTGSSLITGPSGQVEMLMKKIPQGSDCSVMDRMPKIDVQLLDEKGNVVSYPLTPKDYSVSTTEEVGSNNNHSHNFLGFPVLGQQERVPIVRKRCEPSIGVMDTPGRKWVLGDSFLRRFYSIFDDDRKLVGLVRSVHVDEQPQQQQPDSTPSTDTVSIGDPSSADGTPWWARVAPQKSASVGLAPLFFERLRPTRCETRLTWRDRGRLNDFL